MDPLYSTSNVNTPNGRGKGKARNLAPPAHPPQLLGVPGATDTVSSGRMTLRSVHDTLTEELKARLGNRRIEQEQPLSPLEKGASRQFADGGYADIEGRDKGTVRRITSTSPVSKSGHTELPTATNKKSVIEATDGV